MPKNVEPRSPIRSPDLPVELPYRLDSLAATSALVYIWTLPEFRLALARQVEDEPDLPVQLLLRELGLFGSMTPSRVAEHFGMSRSNVSKIVARATARGLVDRAQDPLDGRSTTLALTQAGSEISRRTIEIGDTMMAELTADWSADDIAEWVRLSRRLTASAADYARRVIAASAPR